MPGAQDFQRRDQGPVAGGNDAMGGAQLKQPDWMGMGGMGAGGAATGGPLSGGMSLNAPTAAAPSSLATPAAAGGAASAGGLASAAPYIGVIANAFQKSAEDRRQRAQMATNIQAQQAARNGMPTYGLQAAQLIKQQRDGAAPGPMDFLQNLYRQPSGRG